MSSCRNRSRYAALQRPTRSGGQVTEIEIYHNRGSCESDFYYIDDCVKTDLSQ